MLQLKNGSTLRSSSEAGRGHAEADGGGASEAQGRAEEPEEEVLGAESEAGDVSSRPVCCPSLVVLCFSARARPGASSRGRAVNPVRNNGPTRFAPHRNLAYQSSRARERQVSSLISEVEVLQLNSPPQGQSNLVSPSASPTLLLNTHRRRPRRGEELTRPPQTPWHPSPRPSNASPSSAAPKPPSIPCSPAAEPSFSRKRSPSRAPSTLEKSSSPSNGSVLTPLCEVRFVRF